MRLEFLSSTPKDEVFNQVAAYLENEKFRIEKHDFSRPWGVFFVLDESLSN
jgi:hypothetical protein